LLPPQSFAEPAKRPTVEKIEDELDQWGRPKKKLSNPIDVMPDDMQVRGLLSLGHNPWVAYSGNVVVGLGCLADTTAGSIIMRRS
jgi:hypothetical protein